MNSNFEKQDFPTNNKSAIDLKVIILGSSNVGKTAFIQRYLKGNFIETYTTIGASFSLKQWGDYCIAIWDTAGEEKFNGLSTFYCRGADVAIFAYDLTDAGETLKKLNTRFKDLLSIADPHCLPIVIGTKCDLLTSDSSDVNGENKSHDLPSFNDDTLNLIGSCHRRHLDTTTVNTAYFRTSALTGENVCAVFDYAFSEQILRRDRGRRYNNPREAGLEHSISLTGGTRGRGGAGAGPGGAGGAGGHERKANCCT